MQLKKIFLTLYLILQIFQISAVDNKIPLNNNIKITNIPEYVIPPDKKVKELNISKVEKTIIKDSIQLTLNTNNKTKEKRLLVCYFNFKDEIVVFIFDSNKFFNFSSKTNKYTLLKGLDPEETFGYKSVDKKNMQCKMKLSMSTLSSRTFRNETVYNLNGKSGTLFVFIIEGDDAGDFLPTVNKENNNFIALSNVFKMEISL